MRLRAMVLKRPLRVRSSLTSCAASKLAAASSGELNGTIAIGMASSCPWVTSTTSSADAREVVKANAINASTANGLFIGLES
jgi:hypothetical protein